MMILIFTMYFQLLFAVAGITWPCIFCSNIKSWRVFK